LSENNNFNISGELKKRKVMTHRFKGEFPDYSAI